MKLTERYSRGRGQDKLIDEYTMGQLDGKRKSPFQNEIIEVPFELDFVFVQSEMDRIGIIIFGKRNFFWPRKREMCSLNTPFMLKSK